MKRAVATRIANDSGAEVIDVVREADPAPREGWVVVDVRAAALNRHDWWAIHGIGVGAERFALGLGSDVSGVARDGSGVLVHALIADPAGSEWGTARSAPSSVPPGVCGRRSTWSSPSTRSARRLRVWRPARPSAR
jgi:hypothetical protein